MAEMGQCKACRRGVSDEAAVCPHCGQPAPCLLVPPAGTVDRARVTSVTPGGDFDAKYISVTLSSGATAVFTVPRDAPTISEGDELKVRVDGSYDGNVLVGLVPMPTPSAASGCALRLSLVFVVLFLIGSWQL
jgi:hypothetical protein